MFGCNAGRAVLHGFYTFWVMGYFYTFVHADLHKLCLMMLCNTVYEQNVSSVYFLSGGFEISGFAAVFIFHKHIVI